MSVPSEVLDYPWPEAQIPSAVDEFLGLADWISPSFYLRKGIEIVLDVDPVEWLSSEFAGDWQKVAQAASALEQLGEYAYALASDVERLARDMREEWRGNAASNATTYFDDLAVAVAALTAPLAEIAGAFDTTATGIKAQGEVIADLLGLVLDHLIEIGVAAAATGREGEHGHQRDGQGFRDAHRSVPLIRTATGRSSLLRVEQSWGEAGQETPSSPDRNPMTESGMS